MTDIQYELYLFILTKYPEFIRFLRNNNVLLNYFRNIKCLNKKDLKTLYKDINNMKNSSKLIICVFAWSKSREGFYFWEMIFRKYRNNYISTVIQQLLDYETK